MTILARESIHGCYIRGEDIVELFPSRKIKAIELTSLLSPTQFQPTVKIPPNVFSMT